MGAGARLPRQLSQPTARLRLLPLWRGATRTVVRCSSVSESACQSASGCSIASEKVQRSRRAWRRSLIAAPDRPKSGILPGMAEESTTPDLVELVRRQSEAANRRDIDAVMSSFAVDAVFEGRALGDIFEGRAAIRAFVEGWFGMYRNWSTSLRRSTTSATELCLLWSTKRLGLLASPVTFSKERDGSTSRWEI